MAKSDAQKLLDEGTRANILKYFGLTWTPGAGTNGVGGYWTYNNGITSGGTTLIGSLYDPTSTSTARDVVSTNPGREPDFFELLKAGINVGAIGKDWAGIGTNGYQGVQDSSIAPQIFAIGANIIDEASVTQYPTTIRYYNASNDIRTIYGKTDLPYCNGDITFVFVAQPPTTLPTSSGPPMATTTPIDSTPGNNPLGAGYYPAVAGTAVIMFAPSIWNPYDINSPQVSPGFAPARLRIVVGDPLSFFDSQPMTPWPPQPIWLMNTTNPWLCAAQDVFSTPPPNWLAPPPYTYAPSHYDNSTPPNLIPPTFTSPSGPNPWKSEESTALFFDNVNPDPTKNFTRALYHEPTLLFRLTSGSTNNPDQNMNLHINTAVHHIPTMNSAWMNGIPETGSGQAFIGELLGTFPMRFTVAGNSTGTPKDLTPYYLYTNDQVSTVPPKLRATWRMEYLLPGSSPDSPSNWIPYQDKLVSGSADGLSVPAKPQTGFGSAPYLLLPNDATSSGGTGRSLFYGNGSLTASPANSAGTAYEAAWDPRTDRWSVPGDVSSPKFLNGNYSVSSTGMLTAGSMSPTTLPPPTLMMETYRPNGTGGGYTHSGTIPGWHRDGGNAPAGNGPVLGVISQNTFNTPAGTRFYCYGADTVTRRGSGGGNPTYAPTTSTYGLPLATATSNYNSGALSSDSTTNYSNRPLMLHRPYRTVAELAYVFSDTPWLNLDFNNPESGFNGLLDLFCVNEDNRLDTLTAGQVDLNTRQPSVLTALMTNAYRETVSPANGVITNPAMITSEAAAMAQDLITRTTSVFLQKGPLANVSDLVGRYVSNYGGSSANASAASDNYQSFDGFSADLGPTNPTLLPDIVERLREAPIRALSSQGQAGTWNLMIDVIAQTGRYPANVTKLQQFSAEGERRYWVHVAIDRQTGQVIDQQSEQVNE